MQASGDSCATINVLTDVTIARETDTAADSYLSSPASSVVIRRGFSVLPPTPRLSTPAKMMIPKQLTVVLSTLAVLAEGHRQPDGAAFTLPRDVSSSNDGTARLIMVSELEPAFWASDAERDLLGANHVHFVDITDITVCCAFSGTIMVSASLTVISRMRRFFDS